MFNDLILNELKEIIEEREVFLVGGYLRNWFLNKEISCDRDLVVKKDSKIFAQEIAQKLDGTFIELDSDNKIYRVVLKDKQNYFDVSEALNNDIDEDIKRRDFTVNSIFYNLNKKEIYDPLNGVRDIENKVLKTFNFNNLKDDPLRFLRLFRFKALLGFEIEDELLKYTLENFNLINSVAKERINYEIVRIFEGEFLTDTLLEMFNGGVLGKIFPFVEQIKKIPSNSHHHLDLIHHSIETVSQIKTENPLLKLAAFYHDIGKPATWTIEPNGRHRFIGHDMKGAQIAKNELSDLKFSNKQITYITNMIKYHIYPASLINSAENNKAFARFVRKLGDDALDVIELARADRKSALGVDVTKEMLELTFEHLDNLEKYYKEVQSIVKAPKSLLDGNEIMKILNIKPSKLIGEIVDELKELQIMGKISSKDEAKEFVLKKYLK